MPDLLLILERVLKEIRYESAYAAKTVRTLLTTPQLKRPFREPFTPECMRGEEWLAEVESDTEVWDAPLSATFNDEPPAPTCRCAHTVYKHTALTIQDKPVGTWCQEDCGCNGFNESLQSPDAAGATVASVEDPSPDVPPASGEADSGVGPCPDCGLDTAFYPDQCIICGDKPDWKALFAHPGRIMAIPEPDGVVIPSTVTRVVLVHGNYPERTVTEKWAQEWDLHIQDDGRTLKLFSKNPTGPRYEDTPGFFDLPGGAL